MALARNLHKPKKKISPKLLKNKKVIYIGAAVLIFIFAAYGVINLSRIASIGEEKQELKLETGDRPLPQKLSLWVSAPGGLNMRKEPNTKAGILILIPNGTALSAEESRDDWYKVTYMEKTGWISKKYITTEPPAEDPIKDWKTFQNKDAAYSVRYPIDWVYQNYGANPATNSLNYVGFGMGLSAELNPSSLPPVIIRQSSRAVADLEAEYAKMPSAVSEPVTISGVAGKKFTFNSSAGVQLTVYLIGRGAGSYIFEETGGYADELIKITNSVILL